MPSKPDKVKWRWFSVRVLLVCFVIAVLFAGWRLWWLDQAHVTSERQETALVESTRYSIGRLAELDATDLPAILRDAMWSDVTSGKIVGQPKNRYEAAFVVANRKSSTGPWDLYSFDLMGGTLEGIALTVYVRRSTGEIRGLSVVEYIY